MKKLTTNIIHTLKKYNLIEEGDKVAVGLSGGKDSLALLHALKEIQRFYQPHFELVAITVDNYSGQQSYDKLITFCKENNIDYFK